MENNMYIISEADISAYAAFLSAEERAEATIEKYSCDICSFVSWLSGENATKEKAVAYKKLLSESRKATGVNAVLAALNGFFSFCGLPIKLKPMKIQKQTYRSKERELTRAEYERLCRAADAGNNERLRLVMQTICATGIRVSELRFITVEAVRGGEAEITNKGKTRTVFLPGKLRKRLLAYTKARGILSGCVFVTKSGKPMNRSNIWSEMKRLCQSAGVAAGKVFPHNLRALFARTFYSVDKDIMRLADILGHSSVNTTRIYIAETGENHRRRIEALGLIT